MSKRALDTPPISEDGSEYSARWQRGARTLEELAPEVAQWVSKRAKRRGRRVVFVLLVGGLFCALMALSVVAPALMGAGR